MLRLHPKFQPHPVMHPTLRSNQITLSTRFQSYYFEAPDGEQPLPVRIRRRTGMLDFVGVEQREMKDVQSGVLFSYYLTVRQAFRLGYLPEQIVESLKVREGHSSYERLRCHLTNLFFRAHREATAMGAPCVADFDTMQAVVARLGREHCLVRKV